MNSPPQKGTFKDKIMKVDYWKSQAKKYCEFCKCWIADNKPSVGFHESGKRHKENVAKKLAEITKNSAKSYKEELQVDYEMKKMEKEALKAYMKDLQENPDYTSKKILEETEKKKKELENSVRQISDEASKSSTGAQGQEKEKKPKIVTAKVWNEAKSEEGHTYYWNIHTAESIWEPPEEGYNTIEEQERQQQEVKLKAKSKKKEEKNKGKERDNRSTKERENLVKKRKTLGNKKESEIIVAAGPAPKPDPYGSWTVIEPKVEEPLDLELPQQEFVAIKVPELIEPAIKFKEKTVTSLEADELYGTFKKEIDECAGGFKKRKVNRGNMRQKLDTE